MEDIDVLARADRAKRLLDDPDLKAAFLLVREAIHQRFEQTLRGDRETLKEQLYDLRQQLYLLDSIQEQLKIAVEEGNLELVQERERERGGFLGEIEKWNKTV